MSSSIALSERLLGSLMEIISLSRNLTTGTQVDPLFKPTQMALSCVGIRVSLAENSENPSVTVCGQAEFKKGPACSHSMWGQDICRSG